MTKPCTKCHIVKPLSEYHKAWRAKDGKQSRCKACMISAALKWGRDNREAKNRNARASIKRTVKSRWAKNISKKFNLSVKDYEKMLTLQNNACAICAKPEKSILKSVRRVKQLAVDHCHASGRIRGLLCAKCNTFLGLANDDPAVLHSAIEYLGRDFTITADGAKMSEEQGSDDDESAE